MAETTEAVNVDDLAQEIRRVDGAHRLGAGALAEALMPFLEGRRPEDHCQATAACCGSPDPERHTFVCGKDFRRRPELTVAQTAGWTQTIIQDRPQAALTAMRGCADILRAPFPGYPDEHLERERHIIGLTELGANSFEKEAIIALLRSAIQRRIDFRDERSS